MDIVDSLREIADGKRAGVKVMPFAATIHDAADNIERLRKGFVWLDDTIEGHLLLNPEKNSNLIQEIKRKISFILSNGEE